MKHPYIARVESTEWIRGDVLQGAMEHALHTAARLPHEVQHMLFNLGMAGLRIEVSEAPAAAWSVLLGGFNKFGVPTLFLQENLPRMRLFWWVVPTQAVALSVARKEYVLETFLKSAIKVVSPSDLPQGDDDISTAIAQGRERGDNLESVLPLLPSRVLRNHMTT